MILIADDDPVVRKLLGAAIEYMGYTAHLAADSSEALCFAFHEVVSVILLDLQMPGLSGESFCRQYRASGGHAPIVIMTGLTGAQLADTVARCQPDAVLVKPFRLSALRQTIQLLQKAAASP